MTDGDPIYWDHNRKQYVDRNGNAIPGITGEQPDPQWTNYEKSPVPPGGKEWWITKWVVRLPDGTELDMSEPRADPYAVIVKVPREDLLSDADEMPEFIEGLIGNEFTIKGYRGSSGEFIPAQDEPHVRESKCSTDSGNG